MLFGEKNKRLLQPWERINFQTPTSSQVGNLSAEMLESMAGLDLSPIQDRIQDFAMVEIAGQWRDHMLEQLEIAWEEYQAAVNDDDPWYQDFFGFVAEWTLNFFLPGAGTILSSLYEWDQDLDAFENYENAVSAVNENYKGTYLEEYAESAVDALDDVKKQINLANIMGMGLGLVMPQIGDWVGDKVFGAIKDTEVGKWFSNSIGLEMGADNPAFDDAMNLGITTGDITQAAQDFAEDAGTYEAIYDMNMDGVIDMNDSIGYTNALTDSNFQHLSTMTLGDDITKPKGFFEALNPFEKGDKIAIGGDEKTWSVKELSNILQNPDSNDTPWSLEEISSIINEESGAPVQLVDSFANVDSSLEALNLNRDNFEDSLWNDDDLSWWEDNYKNFNNSYDSAEDAKKAFEAHYENTSYSFDKQIREIDYLMKNEFDSSAYSDNAPWDEFWEKYENDPRAAEWKSYDWNKDGNISVSDTEIGSFNALSETMGATVKEATGYLPGMYQQQFDFKGWKDYWQDLKTIPDMIPEAPKSIYEEWTGSRPGETILGGLISSPMLGSNETGVAGMLQAPIGKFLGQNAATWLDPYIATAGLGSLMGKYTGYNPSQYVNYNFYNPFKPYMNYTQIPGAYQAPEPSINPMLLRALYQTPNYGQ